MDHSDATDYFASFGWTLTREQDCRYDLYDADDAQRCSQMELAALLDWWTVVVGFAYVLEQSTKVALHLASQSAETREMIRRWAKSKGTVALPSDIQFEIDLPEKDLRTDRFDWVSEGARLAHLVARDPPDLEGEVFARLRADDWRMLSADTQDVSSHCAAPRRL